MRKGLKRTTGELVVGRGGVEAGRMNTHVLFSLRREDLLDVKKETGLLSDDRHT